MKPGVSSSRASLAIIAAILAGRGQLRMPAG
jgi:hypothetical protein